MRQFLFFAILVICCTRALCADQVTSEILNNTFEPGDEGVPFDWKAYPPPNGEGTKFESNAGGGLTIIDHQNSASAGIGQWIKVKGGHKYRASLVTEGIGDVLFVINFTPRIPPKIGQMSQSKVLELKATVQAGQTGVLEGVTPLEAACAWVWIQSPVSSKIDSQVTVKSVTIEDMGAVPPESVPPAATPKPRKS